MALTVNCNLCADPTCDGKEFTVRYDYYHYGRVRGTKIVCSSQVYKQGSRLIHAITEAGKYTFKFEAIPVVHSEVLDEEINESFLPEGESDSDVMETFKKVNGKTLVEIDKILESEPYGIIDEETENVTAGSDNSQKPPREDGKLQEQKTPPT